MSLSEVVRWLHLLAAATWTGGLIALAALVPVLRRTGSDRPQLQAIARRFGVVSWSAMAVAVVTGVWQVIRLHFPWSDVALKVTLVIVAFGLALVHQLTARHTSPGVRGALQGMILVVSIAIFGAAVAL